MVCFTLPSGHKGRPAVIFGASSVLIPSRQAHTSLSDTLWYLKHAKEDSLVLVSMPMNPTLSPQLWKRKYMSVLPINSDSDVDRGPLRSFAAALLPTASCEGTDAWMTVRVKLLPCFGSSKWSKTEMLSEAALLWGPLWQNFNFVECNASSQVVLRKDGKPICQEMLIKLVAPGQ